MAYSLINIYAKNYWDRTITVTIIVGGWDAYFFETQYSWFASCPVVDGILDELDRHQQTLLLMNTYS